MKPKAIYMAGRDAAIPRVYNGEIKEKISALVDITDTVVNRENLAQYKDTELIFSTWGMLSLTEAEVKEYLPNLKVIFYGAGSVQAFAEPYLNCNGRIVSAWVANAIPVAEYTMSMILLSAKGTFHCLQKTKKERSAASRIANSLPGNYKAKIGIIGAGAIGRRVIENLKSSDVIVYVFDPFLGDEAAAELGVTKCSLDEIFSECHIVSNHLANNKETQGMLGYKHFSGMKQYATFINTGRGAQVVEPDLCRALKERPDLMAILDVTDPEPPQADNPLLTLDNCLLTPHIAGAMSDEIQRMGYYMYDELVRYLNGEKLLYEVTADMLKTMA